MSGAQKTDLLAQRLATLRRRLGKTQAEFAPYFHISRATYVRWEMSGPPDRGPVRAFVLMLIRRMQKQAHYREQKAKRIANAGQRPSAH